jgi:hypothetical protein
MPGPASGELSLSPDRQDEGSPSGEGNWARELIDAFYTKFLLRDLLAKAVPGGLALAVGTLALAKAADLRVIPIDIPLPVWAFMIGASWMLGMALQAVGERTGLTMSRFDGSAVWLGGWLARQRGMEVLLGAPMGHRCSRDALKRRDDTLHWSLRRLDSSARRMNERLVILKEACGNASMALAVSIPIAFLSGIISITDPVSRWAWISLGSTAAAALWDKHWRVLREQYSLLRDECPDLVATDPCVPTPPSAPPSQ